MSKPLGIGMECRDGAVVMAVRHPSRVEDKIWEAVREATSTPGWTPTLFIREAWSAWETALDDDKSAALDEFARLFRSR